MIEIGSKVEIKSKYKAGSRGTVKEIKSYPTGDECLIVFAGNSKFSQPRWFSLSDVQLVE